LTITRPAAFAHGVNLELLRVNIAFGHVLLEKATDFFGTLCRHFYTSSATWERQAPSIENSAVGASPP
jgi:hypothetical protein